MMAVIELIELLQNLSEPEAAVSLRDYGGTEWKFTGGYLFDPDDGFSLTIE